MCTGWRGVSGDSRRLLNVQVATAAREQADLRTARQGAGSRGMVCEHDSPQCLRRVVDKADRCRELSGRAHLRRRDRRVGQRGSTNDFDAGVAASLGGEVNDSNRRNHDRDCREHTDEPPTTATAPCDVSEDVPRRVGVDRRCEVMKIRHRRTPRGRDASGRVRRTSAISRFRAQWSSRPRLRRRCSHRGSASRRLPVVVAAMRPAPPGGRATRRSARSGLEPVPRSRISTRRRALRRSLRSRFSAT